MAKTKTDPIVWLENSEEHDYPAAESCQWLRYPEAAALVQRLRQAQNHAVQSQGHFLCSQSFLLGVSNSHMEKDRQGITKGLAMSPLKLCRDAAHGRLRSIKCRLLRWAWQRPHCDGAT